MQKAEQLSALEDRHGSKKDLDKSKSVLNLIMTLVSCEKVGQAWRTADINQLLSVKVNVLGFCCHFSANSHNSKYIGFE